MAIELMICGNADADEAIPLDLVAAAKSVGMRPDTLRRYLNRPAVIQYIRAERRAFRQSLLAGNDAALKRVRDTSPNGMAVIASVRQIEAMEEAEQSTHGSNAARQTTPGVVIHILTPAVLAPPVIDVTSVKPDTTIPRPLSPAPLHVRPTFGAGEG